MCYKCSKKKKERVLLRDNHKCRICGEIENLQVHHIIKKSEGGSNELVNLITLCSHCHGIIHEYEQISKNQRKDIILELNCTKKTRIKTALKCLNTVYNLAETNAEIILKNNNLQINWRNNENKLN